MVKLTLPYELSFKDLYDREGLIKLDASFLDFLEDHLRVRLLQARFENANDESALILELAPHLEDFLGTFFGIAGEIHALQESTHAISPIFSAKRQFVQRIAAKTFSKGEVESFDGATLYRQLETLIHPDFKDLDFAKAVLGWLYEEDHLEALALAKKYAAFQIHEKTSSELFRLPQKKNYGNLVDTSLINHTEFILESKSGMTKEEKAYYRDGFNCTTPPASQIHALDQAHYCIWCHHQGKDSCSKGLKVKGSEGFQKNPLEVSLEGCPLEEKISEMNELRTQGYTVAALATLMIDNPMVAGTGHRICNDCITSCIYQKQDPVDVPSIESETLQSTLRLPWGFEIYSLLSRWNPLNFKRPFPEENSGCKILVAGMGPAGYTLAHHLLQEGHTVFGIDGLKIEPLPEDLQKLEPIYKIHDYLTPLSKRIVSGFGGVAEYGITARWDKNNLTLIRLLLERRSQFSLKGGVRLGGTITLDQAFDDYGFDHVALCLGSGKPKLLEIPGGLPRGVRMASDFLMALQLTGADKINSLANLELRLPILVVGGGLTAMDTATEALAYYPLQVERFLQRYEILGPQNNWSEDEKNSANIFIAHAKTIREERAKAQAENRSPEILNLLQSWGGCTLIYRKSLQEAPAYRLNHEEITSALAQGISILENTTPHAFLKDRFGHLSHLQVEKEGKVFDLPAGSALLALGTQPNTQIAEEVSLALQDGNFKAENDIFISRTPGRSISYLGDLNPHFSGSVVKAMASAKKAYPLITEMLKVNKNLQSHGAPKQVQDDNMAAALSASVVAVNRLTPTIVEVVVHAPLASRNFKPGQFFRLQNFESLARVKNGTRLAMEGLALTGASANPEKGTVNLIVLEMGGSSNLCALLKPGEPVILMGPTGTPTEILPHKNVLLIGGGLGNAVLFSIGEELKKAGSKVLYVAGYKNAQDRFKTEEIETASDQVIWCCDEKMDWKPKRSHDRVFQGNVIEAILYFSENGNLQIPLPQIDHIIAIGSDRMMAAVAHARESTLKNKLSPHHTAIGSINSPMQCMMKAICAQCLQAHQNPQTGEVSYVFSCVNQDQLLETLDFTMLQDRLGQNSLSEKLTKAWIEALKI
ncbi:Putative glutamate synthase (NADPH) small subunit [Candidatus Bealeia paramacronuclearis]|uniref:Glutamate synthase (NADPH) small subunit n=1 Tax=Candidatus Bealeia paramacronuclearis TaxID=1921001 RepID=A0ABZ2C626_9PROT|nr:putative glutamate synthase (NADPH) small subunit [Candidatus Bealeia paramacronuclearis]